MQNNFFVEIFNVQLVTDNIVIFLIFSYSLDFRLPQTIFLCAHNVYNDVISSL